MLWPVFEIAFLILCALAIYNWRRPIGSALRRFDAANRERIEAERRDRFDSLAHFRHTLARAGEQIEEVGEFIEPDSRTGTPVKRFLFEGTTYATRADAEAARESRVRELARRFYVELPARLRAPRDDSRLN